MGYYTNPYKKFFKIQIIADRERFALIFIISYIFSVLFNFTFYT